MKPSNAMNPEAESFRQLVKKLLDGRQAAHANYDGRKVNFLNDSGVFRIRYDGYMAEVLKDGTASIDFEDGFILIQPSFTEALAVVKAIDEATIQLEDGTAESHNNSNQPTGEARGYF